MPNVSRSNRFKCTCGRSGARVRLRSGTRGAPATITDIDTQSAGVPITQRPESPQKTGVIFDWPETDPNTTSSQGCKPGHYVGEFSCRLHIITMGGDGAFDLSGSVELTLEETTSGEILRIRDGHYASTSAAVIPATADIVGELNCSSSRFMVRLENGLFSVALGIDVPFTQGTFSGPLQADYDKNALAMTDGTWMMTGELDGFPGSCPDGMWSASLVP
jgi:hypothetical protein